jgi:serine/threonine protein kinase
MDAKKAVPCLSEKKHRNKNKNKKLKLGETVCTSKFDIVSVLKYEDNPPECYEEGFAASPNIVVLVKNTRGGRKMRKVVLKIAPSEFLSRRDIDTEVSRKRNKEYQKAGNAEVEAKILERLTSENIPHIVKMYDYTKCKVSSPLLQKFPVLVSNYMQGRYRRDFVVMLVEYIPESVSLNTFLESQYFAKHASKERVLKQIVFTVVYTLALLHDKFKLMHNDFHFENILVQFCNVFTNPCTREYTFKNKLYTLGKQDVSVKFWDFEFSAMYRHPQIRNPWVSSGGRQHDGVYDRFDPVSDSNRFLSILCTKVTEVNADNSGNGDRLFSRDYERSVCEFCTRNQNVPPVEMLDDTFFSEFA